MENLRIKTGLFFGSFNPVHVGHTIVAMHALETGLDEVWMVVSPHNPFKDKKEMVDKELRLNMVYKACFDLKNIVHSDVEFGLPEPSYTYDTLKFLSESNKDRDFSVIIGTDVALQIHKWKNAKQLLAEYDFLVFPRSGYHMNANDWKKFSMAKLLESPSLEMSSTYIRKRVSEGKPVTHMVCKSVEDIIRIKELYKL